MKWLLIILLCLFGFSCSPFASTWYTRAPTRYKIVIMYSTSWCGWCKKAKKFMEEENIYYIEKDFDDRATRLQLYKKAKKLGYDIGKLNGVPIFLIGRFIVVGFNPREILCLLGQKECKGALFVRSKTLLK